MESLATDFLQPTRHPPVDFSVPLGEPSLVGPDSVAWQVFRNPVSLFVGGVAAVILELAEPRVRAGVWDHSSFRTDAVDRLRRTGLAAMITVYGARSIAEETIAGVRRIHDRIDGKTAAGEPYRANDPELLNWVQATASFGFLQAYCAYVRPLAPDARNSFYLESLPAAHLYGATGAARSEAELDRQFAAMRPRLGRSDVLVEFLRIMRSAPVFPAPLRPMQRLLVRAAIDMVPPWARTILKLDGRSGLRASERRLVRLLGRAAGRLRLDASPAAQASIRLGLPPDYLWKTAKTSPTIRSSSPS